MAGVTSKNSATLGSFYGDLELLLRQQLKDDPSLHHVPLKLLEIFYETGRGNEYLREARSLTSGFDRQQHAVEWKRIASMGRMLGLNDPLFQAARDEPIEFIAPIPKAEAARGSRTRRVGDDPVSQEHFRRLATDYEKVRSDPRFLLELDLQLMRLANRPSPLLHARRLSQKLGGAQIYLKREDLSPAGWRVAISFVGQALLAGRLKKTTLITASVNGVRGVVAASVAARLGLRALILMDQDDLERQAAHAFHMRLLGAVVQPVDRKKCAGGDVRQAALELWTKHESEYFLLMGLDAWPHPYPMMAREFASVVGRECRRQIVGQTKRVPDLLVARAGNNADAIGFFEPFLADAGTRLVCVEANGGRGEGRKSGIEDPFDERRRRVLSESQNRLANAILEGLEYPSVTREHAFLKASGRVEFTQSTVAGARQAIKDLAHEEGIAPAIETAHAVAWAMQAATSMAREQAVVIMIAENAERYIWEIAKFMGESI